MDFDLGAVFSDLFDTAKGVFNRAVDFEFTRKELDIQREITAFNAAQARDDLARRNSFNTNGGVPSTSGGISTGTVVVIAALGIGGLLLLRR
ncbi:hypothetical protein [Pelagibius sp.]|uniref:hypothetical protein n=1 Tax=Pelagibius sp. TaxID=1931238 RepID=UPI002620CBC6|nr:hypothetical protein [Pelagibius sp.]